MSLRVVVTLVCAVAAALAGGPVQADVLGRSTNRGISTGFTAAYLGLGALLPLTENRREGRAQAMRAVDSAVITFGLTEGFKQMVREERPNHSGNDSFPSAHTSVAFSIATVESAFYPRQAPLWYAGATLIGLSRLDSGSHFGQDVAFGALLGYGVARWELSQRRGLLISPWYPRDSGAAGMALTAHF